MLQLKNIKKDYTVAGQPIPALCGIDLSFKQNEFVAVLGPSGCGKTTLLNIIGGLDRYSSGDLLVDGKSTNDFSDADWDAYRNASIGFVFQNYNLISHLTVLDNVEMALRLSGINAKERKERSVKVLTDVGLADQLYKRPNQLSGGQMQRVAIARALVNNPKILLADEPTGALDSKTSEQIMELIREISKDRLVIMVTHNKEIADRYSDRLIRLLDGRVIEDTRPTELPAGTNAIVKMTNRKTAMSYMTALRTSFKNLLTKKGRTIITAIAGSIGIIGIALVLSISTGMTSYVNEMQSDTLAGFPLTINSTVSTDIFAEPRNRMSDPMGTLIDTDEFPTELIIYSYDAESNTTLHKNLIDADFLAYLDAMDPTLFNSMSFTRSIALNIVAESSAGGYLKVSTSTSGGMNPFGGGTVFAEIPDNATFIQSQYDILSGVYPTAYNELVLIVDSKNQLDVQLLEALGVGINESYTFADFLGKTFTVLPNDTYYQVSGGLYIPRTDYGTMSQSPEAIPLEIVGILRVSPDASSELLSSGIGYTTDLTEHMLTLAESSAIVTSQVASPTVNVLSGQAFNTQVTYQNVMRSIGGDDTPTGVQIYPVSFDTKETIKTYLDAYNVGAADIDTIVYTDLAETISTTISSLIDTITIILAAFAGISLVVSSIMIGIITYVSVVERTKEIGIMRSLGARKKDISRIFNAETILIGLGSGLLGVTLAALLNIPVNFIINKLIGVPGFSLLTLDNAVVLVVLSTILTLIAGLIPSGIAARKDPVIALRTE